MAEDEAAAPTGSPSPAAATPAAVAAAPAAAAAAAPADAPSTPTAAAPSPSAAAAAAAPAASSSAKLVKYPIPQGPIDVNDWLLDINSRVKPTEGFAREVQGRGMYYVAKLMIKHEYHGKIIGENGRTVKWLLQHSPKKFFKNTPSLLVTTPKKIHTNDHNVYVKSTELPNLKFIVGLVLELATVFTEEESALKVLKRRIRDAEKEVARYVKERDQIYWEFPELKPKPPAKRPRSDTLAPPPSKAVKTQADQTPQTAPKVEGAAIKAEIKPDAAAAPATPAAAAPGARPDNLPPLEPGPSVASATVAAASPSSAAAAPATPTPTTPTAEAAMEVEDFDGFHSPQLSDNELLDLNRSGPTPFSLRLDFEGENDELEGFPGDVERGPQSDEEADETGETGAHDESHADESAEVEAEAEVEGETPADEQPDQDVQPEDEPSDETRRDDDEEQLDVGDQEHPDVGDLQSDAELYDPRTPEGQMAEGEEQQPEGEEYAAADGDEFGGETHPDDGAVDEYGASHAEDEAQPQDIEQEETGAASSDDHGAAASDQVEQGVEPPPEGVAAAEAPAADQGGDVAPATDVPPSDASAEGANDAPAPMEVSEHADSSATA